MTPQWNSIDKYQKNFTKAIQNSLQFKSTDELMGFNLLMLYMTWYIHENPEKFKIVNGGKVWEVVGDMNSSTCKLIRSNFDYLDDEWVSSMSLAILIYFYLITQNTNS